MTGLARGVRHCRDRDSARGSQLLFLSSTHGGSSGQRVSQAVAAVHGLGRPQLRAWFLCGEPGQKSSQGPDGVL